MNLQISELSAPELDPEIVPHAVARARPNLSRRDALRATGLYGAAVAASPFVLASLAQEAYGQTLPANVRAVLELALTLEHLEYDFYVEGVAMSGLIPAADRALFTTIRDHEGDHVRFLQRVLGLPQGFGPGAAGRPANGFDFTAGGALPTMTSYPTYLVVSQGFEDTGVRAYKGQAGNLIAADAILEAALQIHSVEARHASAVRRLRGQKGWITGNNTDNAAIAAVYEGEANVTQGGVNLQTAFSGTYSVNAITEAFDEPLTREQVLAIARPFIRS